MFGVLAFDNGFIFQLAQKEKKAGGESRRPRAGVTSWTSEPRVLRREEPPRSLVLRVQIQRNGRGGARRSQVCAPRGGLQAGGAVLAGAAASGLSAVRRQLARALRGPRECEEPLGRCGSLLVSSVEIELSLNVIYDGFKTQVTAGSIEHALGPTAVDASTQNGLVQSGVFQAEQGGLLVVSGLGVICGRLSPGCNFPTEEEIVEIYMKTLRRRSCVNAECVVGAAGAAAPERVAEAEARHAVPLGVAGTVARLQDPGTCILFAKLLRTGTIGLKARSAHFRLLNSGYFKALDRVDHRQLVLRMAGRQEHQLAASPRPVSADPRDCRHALTARDRRDPDVTVRLAPASVSGARSLP
ncbi:hypothetical protein TREES_T100021821 [Tupaia chinensis]|uniref:Uncharacterized protein n=1 Tax=Tupaia chinensis TaxID=246437 RepID=L9JCW3_TUPCH|nr:hypothetical protein TREES_T100021821 [Tupaia chinensis]